MSDRGPGEDDLDAPDLTGDFSNKVTEVANEAAIRQTFESAGIEFIDENGKGEGVRFRKPRRGTRK